MDTSDSDLERRCCELIDRLRARYAWRLLTCEELLQRAIATARDHPAAELSYIVFGVYNHALHAACSGAEGPLRWEQGYEEVYAMLCDRTRRRYPDVWEDAVQSAIELTCKYFDHCAVPQAFFYFAWGHFRNAVRSLRRKTQGPDISLERTVGSDDQPLADRLEDPSADIIEQFLADEWHIEFRLALRAFVRKNPRALNQLAAVILKYLYGQTDEAISQILGVSVKRVHELRSLGLKKLREDPDMRQWFDFDDEDG